MRNYKNISIVKKTSFLIFLISIVLIALVYSINYYFSFEKEDIILVNISKDNAYKLQIVDDLISKYENKSIMLKIEEILNEYERTNELLKKGGKYEYENNYYTIREANNLELKKLYELDNLFILLKENIQTILNSNNDTILKNESLSVVKQNIIDFKKTNFNLTNLYIKARNENKKSIQYFIYIILAFNFLLIVFVFIINKNIAKRLNKLLENVEVLAKGRVPKRNSIKLLDEIGNISMSINNIANNIENASKFSKEIGEGNYNTEYTVSSENLLGKSLIEMRSKLIKAYEIRLIRDNEDEQRNWTTSGFAKFGEILRSNNDNIEELSNNIISNLIKYVNANQGGFFLINDENENNKYLELISSYAFDRKKFSDKKIEWGSGLVGTCAIENETIFLTDVPNNYVNITSGLGGSNPRCILIVPIKLNEEIIGVIELASFNIFEKFEIEFIEKVAESIASTMISVKTNLKTRELLNISQEQSEILAQKEENLTNNLLELRETQEKALKQSEEFEIFTNAVNHTMIRAEYDPKGYLTYANTKFIEKLGFNNSSDIIGKNIISFIDPIDKEKFYTDWNTLANGGSHFEGDVKHTKKDGKDIWLMSTYVCKRKPDGTIDSVLFLATDITDKKEKDLSNKAEIEAINLSSMKVELDSEGRIYDCNKQFVDNLKYNHNEIIGVKINNLISKSYLAEFELKWSSLFNGESYKGVMPFIDSNGGDKWFQGAASTVKDYHGGIKQIIYIATDVTEQKIMEFEAIKQTEILKQQDKQLREAQNVLEQKLNETRNEMVNQFKEIEVVKVRNELTLEGMVDAILTFDNEGKILFFNKAAEDLWGYNKKDILNKNIAKLFSENTINSDDFVSRLIDTNKEKHVSVRQEVNILTAKNEESSVLMLISEANIEGSKTYTAFVQNIEMELF